MNYLGIIVGVATILIIGVFHPIVIKGEYYFGTRIWPIFLILGLLFLGISLLIFRPEISALLGVLGVTCLWSIIELFEQKERVAKGWFPARKK